MSLGDENIPSNPEDVPRFLENNWSEIVSMVRALQNGELLYERHVAPSRPINGMLVLADGTDWNPGSGRGIYWYDSSISEWQKL